MALPRRQRNSHAITTSTGRAPNSQRSPSARAKAGSHCELRKARHNKPHALIYSRSPSPSSSGPGRHPFKVDIAGSNPAGGTRHCSRPEEFEPLACFFFTRGAAWSCRAVRHMELQGGAPHGTAGRCATWSCRAAHRMELRSGASHGHARRHAALRKRKTHPLTSHTTSVYSSVVRCLSNYLIAERNTNTSPRRRNGRRGIQGAR